MSSDSSAIALFFLNERPQSIVASWHESEDKLWRHDYSNTGTRVTEFMLKRLQEQERLDYYDFAIPKGRFGESLNASWLQSPLKARVDNRAVFPSQRTGSVNWANLGVFTDEELDVIDYSVNYFYVKINTKNDGKLTFEQISQQDWES